MPELVDTFLNQNQNDEAKIILLKSLCWMDQKQVGEKVLASIEIPENLNQMDKLFIREVFNKNLFKVDEM